MANKRQMTTGWGSILDYQTICRSGLYGTRVEDHSACGQNEENDYCIGTETDTICSVMRALPCAIGGVVRIYITYGC